MDAERKGSRAREAYKKIVLVTRKTRLAGLVERFNTEAQARFYIEHAGGDFIEYQNENDAYRRSLDLVRRSIDLGLKVQLIDRELVPTYSFLAEDLVVTLGQDGLVANTAKYVGRQPIVAVNPDPGRFDGVLLPFLPGQLAAVLEEVLSGQFRVWTITLAEAKLNDGQRLLAFNDLFIGARTHVSALYRIRWNHDQEAQSSSGILVSTGAGTTGWMSSVFNMASGVAHLAGGNEVRPIRIGWEDPRLLFVVREPFVSRHSSARLIAGIVEKQQSLDVESLMPTGGVIFSDGVESDYLQFNSGAIVRIGAAQERAHLVIG
ncbi:MAG: hypothetical protein ABSF15_28275 [Candidatus Sulfotelmatobacter sp.]